MINESGGLIDQTNDDSESSAGRLGARVRGLREAHGMSQRKLAQAAGVTNGAISMIEQERVSPSVASLKKVLSVFGLSLTEFFSDEFQPESQFVFRAAELTEISDGNVVLRQVGGDILNRKIQVLHEIYSPGGDTGKLMLSHEGEESGVVVRGEIEITVGGQKEILKPGDGFYFNSRIPHRFRNTGKEVCEIVSACSPPTF